MKRPLTVKKPARKPTLVSEKGLIVTTLHKGVFFGYATKPKAMPKEITLKHARMCIYWSNNVHGVLGLAATGPLTGCKTSPAVPEIKLSDVTSIMECSKDAVTAWELKIWE